jgi:hypothetical protein
MISARILAISIAWAVSWASFLCAEDLSRYRQFQFGMDPATVLKETGMRLADAKVIHARPAVIQELEWRPDRYPGASPADSVKSILFSFCNGELFRMVVNYDRYKTEGLTPEDMIEAISAQYGAATTPDVEIVFPSLYDETVKVLARWEDSRYSLSLVRSSYRPSFGVVVLSKRLDALAQAATVEALRLDQQEAPQREVKRQEKKDEENRIRQEKARLTNKPNFRP